ncbi:hypothetical protein UB46_13445 [Burkholderiaceae bacterium 16]|nr:hypothetical protein UB46_13445 [Burkholderiaceae bacterium 16]
MRKAFIVKSPLIPPDCGNGAVRRGEGGAPSATIISAGCGRIKLHAPFRNLCRLNSAGGTAPGRLTLIQSGERAPD